jgi:tRNA (cytidine32/uridine32-2'-O)-methyltransferase
MNPLDSIRFVLVEPAFGGNVGSTARALKTMGLSRLALVQPECHPQGEEAMRLAHNAEDVLEAATSYPSLAEAVADCRVVIGTTNRPRRDGRAPLLPEEAAEELWRFAAEGPVALVLGRESSGLSSSELALCTDVSSIPAACSVPSLNLAQAAMVYAAAIHRVATRSEPPAQAESLPATHGELEGLVEHLGRTLEALGTRPAVSMEKLLEKCRRMLGRGRFEGRDVLLIHKLLESAERYVRNHPSR